MMQQYLEVKATCPDALLMYRLGDFYELFMEDAITASRVLDITLTGRDAGEPERIPMCGVPHHAVDNYIARLVDEGFKIAICEQVENPKETKGLVRREIVRIVTPGTYIPDAETSNRFLGCIVGQGPTWGAALIDVGTGEVWYASLGADMEIRDLLQTWQPVEILCHETVPVVESWAKANRVCLTQLDSRLQQSSNLSLEQQYPNDSPLPDGVGDEVRASCASLIAYIRDTQRAPIHHLHLPREVSDASVLKIDEVAVQNLELLETTRLRQRSGSLLGLLDETLTAMGGRLLRQWVLRPPRNITEIHSRQDAIDELVRDVFFRETVRSCLNAMYDLDRLTARVSLGSATARDLVSLGRTLDAVPGLFSVLTACGDQRLSSLASSLSPELAVLAGDILETFVDQPPMSVREGGMVRDGVDPDLDAFKRANSDGKAWILELEAREREATGIKSLKVGYNKVFGYYLEVSKTNVPLVPSHYERRQTLASAERYVLPEMKEKEAFILQAADKQFEREFEIFTHRVTRVLEVIVHIQDLSQRIAQIDVLQSLAHVAVRERYVKPTVVKERVVQIEQGRHPVVESLHPGSFVPNHTMLNDNRHLLLITGPNMAGKSTYMRQTAQIVLLAHMGSFVPAKAATIGLVDRLFTRIGASDDLGRGQSTFMVEMVELASILRSSTNRSLVLLDEIGRGTSTYDGLCIAEAVLEALTKPEQCPFTLFATHYHELTQTAERLTGVVNLSVLVDEDGMDIRFLHSVVERPADKSYGIQVARLAGLPMDVVERAMLLLRQREQTQAGALEVAVAPDDGASVVQPLFALLPSPVTERIGRIDINRITPMDALNLLNELVLAAKEELGWA